MKIIFYHIYRTVINSIKHKKVMVANESNQTKSISYNQLTKLRFDIQLFKIP